MHTRIAGGQYEWHDGDLYLVDGSFRLRERDNVLCEVLPDGRRITIVLLPPHTTLERARRLLVCWLWLFKFSRIGRKAH